MSNSLSWEAEYESFDEDASWAAKTVSSSPAEEAFPIPN